MSKSKLIFKLFWPVILFAIVLIYFFSQTSYATHFEHSFKVSRNPYEFILIDFFGNENQLVKFENESIYIGQWNFYFRYQPVGRRFYHIEYGMGGIFDSGSFDVFGSTIQTRGVRFHAIRNDNSATQAIVISYDNFGGSEVIESTHEELAGMISLNSRRMLSAAAVHFRIQEINDILRAYAFILPFSLILGYYFYLQPNIKSVLFSKIIKSVPNKGDNTKIRLLGLLIICLNIFFPVILLWF